MFDMMHELGIDSLSPHKANTTHIIKIVNKHIFDVSIRDDEFGVFLCAKFPILNVY